MVDAGTLGPDERFELIGGHLVARAPQRDTHATSADLAAAALQKAFGFGHRVRVKLPRALDDDSELEPDVSVVRGRMRIGNTNDLRQRSLRPWVPSP